MIDDHIEKLNEHCRINGWQSQWEELPNGSFLIQLKDVNIEGWNRSRTDLLFVAPPGYPSAPPDCFWASPSKFRLQDGATPQGTNDNNPIPDDTDSCRSTT